MRAASASGRKPLRKTGPPAAVLSVENEITLMPAEPATSPTPRVLALNSGPRINAAPSPAAFCAMARAVAELPAVS